MTWVEVLDTAIKIGLGGLIAGIFALINSHLSTHRQREREAAARRWSALEDISAKLETVLFDVTSQYEEYMDYLKEGLRVGVGIKEDDWRAAHTSISSMLREKQLQIQQLEGRLMLYFPTEITEHLHRIRQLMDNLLDISRPWGELDFVSESERIFAQVEEARRRFYAQLTKLKPRG